MSHSRRSLSKASSLRFLLSSGDETLSVTIGGRMTSIVCHPEKPACIWTGAAAGGVWQSKDAGRTWHALWRDHETLNIASLAIDLKNPVVIYCGTGEANLSVDSYAGVGIYRTYT